MCDFLFLFLPDFDINCDLLLYRRMEPFVKQIFFLRNASHRKAGTVKAVFSENVRH